MVCRGPRIRDYIDLFVLEVAVVQHVDQIQNTQNSVFQVIMAPDTNSIAGYAIYNSDVAAEYNDPNPTKDKIPHPLGKLHRSPVSKMHSNNYARPTLRTGSLRRDGACQDEL